VRPYRSTTVRVKAGGGVLAGGAQALALPGGVAALAGGWWGGGVEDAVPLHPAGPGAPLRQVAEGGPVIGGVADQVEPPCGERREEQADQFPGQVDLAPFLFGPPQPGQDRQTDRAVQERQRHQQAEHYPVVAEAGGVLACRGAVVLPGCPEHLLPAPLEQRVVDGDLQRGTVRHKPLDDQAGQRQADLVRGPASLGKEVVCPVVRPHPRQPSPQQHPHHGAPPLLHDQARDQRGERAEGRRGETRPHHLQHREQRRQYGQIRKHRRPLARVG
jgi:hypothetical protein